MFIRTQRGDERYDDDDEEDDDNDGYDTYADLVQSDKEEEDWEEEAISEPPRASFSLTQGFTSSASESMIEDEYYSLKMDMKDIVFIDCLEDLEESMKILFKVNYFYLLNYIQCISIVWYQIYNGMICYIHKECQNICHFLYRHKVGNKIEQVFKGKVNKTDISVSSLCPILCTTHAHTTLLSLTHTHTHTHIYNIIYIKNIKKI